MNHRGAGDRWQVPCYFRPFVSGAFFSRILTLFSIEKRWDSSRFRRHRPLCVRKLASSYGHFEFKPWYENRCAGQVHPFCFSGCLTCFSCSRFRKSSGPRRGQGGFAYGLYQECQIFLLVGIKTLKREFDSSAWNVCLPVEVDGWNVGVVYAIFYLKTVLC